MQVPSISFYHSQETKVNFMNPFTRKLKYALIIAGILSIGIVFGQDQTVRTKTFNLSGQAIAIEGYDPVSYFLDKKPAKGKKELAVYYQGVNYWFATPEHKALFLKNPTAYEPAYGGWCAYAMGAKGEKVSVDPETYKIVNNKLYLFYNRFFNNTLKEWNKDEANLKSKADQSWNKIIQQ